MRRRDGSHAMWQTNKRVRGAFRLRCAGGPSGPDGRSVVVRPTELAPSRIQVPGLQHRHLSVRGGRAHNIQEHGAQKGVLEGSGFLFRPVPRLHGYTAALAAYSALESGSAGYLANVLSSAKDALEYMAVALCAGAWGFAMQRSARRRLLYAAMLVPFIVITMACTYSNLVAEPPQILMAAVDILCLAGIFLCLPRKATSG